MAPIAHMMKPAHLNIPATLCTCQICSNRKIEVRLLGTEKPQLEVANSNAPGYGSKYLLLRQTFTVLYGIVPREISIMGSPIKLTI